jgi:SAM-dependent methyltransferase
MTEGFSYPGRDLEAMSFAENYHRWILRSFAPYLGSRIVEVGAGSGSFSSILAEREPELLVLVEPSASMFAQLTSRLAKKSAEIAITMQNSTFTKVADQIKACRPNSILYVNVLEHIEHDDSELVSVCQTLPSGGRVFVFVPAFPWLLGPFDRKIGHFRRYRKRELEAKCVNAGFKILKSQYFDFLGIAPWWVKYRLLQSDNLEPMGVRLYDKFVVPIAILLERVVTPPAGKNLLLIAEKI